MPSHATTPRSGLLERCLIMDHEPTLGEIGRTVARVEVGVTELRQQLGALALVVPRVDALDQRLKAAEESLAPVATVQVHLESLAERVSRHDAIFQWITWLVLGLVVAAIVGLVLVPQGG